MRYGFYWIGVFLLLGLGAAFSGGTLHAAYFPVLIDRTALAVILVPCVLLLWCTRSWRDFRDAWGFLFGKKELSAAQCKRSLNSLKGVVGMAFLSGGSWAAISVIKFLSQMTGPEALGPMLGLALLSLLYPLLIALILLPVSLSLKKYLVFLQEQEEQK